MAPPGRVRLSIRELSRIRPAVLAGPIRFDPNRGWLRRFERRVSNFLSRAVYPRVPGLPALYDRQLRRDLVLARVRLSPRGLPRGFLGARILLLSDLHAGPFVSPAVLRAAVRRLHEAVRPDLVVLAGDLATYRPEELDPRILSGLSAPLGVFAVLGNHDHYARRPDEIADRLRQAGAEVLHNRSVVLARGGDRLRVAGIDDLMRGAPDLAAATRDGRPDLLLSHHPDAFREAAAAGIPLVLSGHTHGGQIRPPGVDLLVRQSRYGLDEGVYEHRGSLLVVSRGMGVTGAPFRLRCPPEGVEIRLDG